MKKFKGLLLAIISSATFGFIPLFSIPLLKNGVGLDSVCFYRFFFSALIMGIFLTIKKISLKVTFREFVSLFFLTVFYAATSMFLTGSYQYIPSGIATTIHFLYPVLVAVFMILFFREKVSGEKISAIILAIAGVYFLCGGWTGSTSADAAGAIPLKGLLMVLLTVFTYASYIVGVNKTPAINHINGMKMTFYVLADSAFIFLCNILVKGARFGMLPDGGAWANALALALLPTLISDLTLIYAIHMIGSTTTAILGCMEPLTAVIMGIIFFGERLDLPQGAGMALIFVAVFLVILAQRKTSERLPSKGDKGI